MSWDRTEKMQQQVLKTIRRYEMFKAGERVIVAVSGGPDSIALLHVLNQLNMQLCLKLFVAHLDHNLRKDSARDYAFVKKLTGSLRIPFYGRVLDWKKIKKEGSLEECLRRYRYDFLCEAAGKAGATKIALGHTQDDQAETVLMRMLRGSGLYGLCAILPKRRLGAYEIVRPLIEVSRSEVMDYLREKNIPYRIDKTNLKDDFMRNKIRNKLLPMLEKEYNPNIKEVFSNFALTVGADYGYLNSEVDGFFKKSLKKTGRGFSIDLSALKKIDISIRRLALRRAIEALQGDLRRISFTHWQELEDLVYLRPAQAEVHLPFDITVSKTRSCLNIFKR